MPNVVERDGRAICGGEDWGTVIPWNGPLPCCGCALTVLSRRREPELCDCRCHDTAKFIRQDPFVRGDFDGAR